MSSKLNCVLLIDDDEPTNFLNQLIIEEVGCAQNIKALENASSALTFLQKAENNQQCSECTKPDLIFLDLNMPGMSGWDFVEEFEKLALNSDGKPVIVILTNSYNPDDVNRVQQHPVVAGFENKPLTPQLIENILEKYF